MKRILLLFSALMLSISALWAHDVEVDGIYYNLGETKKTAEVTYYGDNYNDYDDEYSGSVTIPETITYNSEIYSVTSIGIYAFRDCSGLTSVTIPNSVTSIGSSAFDKTGIYDNESNWVNGVLYIDNCLIIAKSVKGSYDIKKGTRVIGSWAFSRCSGLTSVTIPNSVTSIGDDAFYGCSGLTSVIWNAKNCEDFRSFSYSPFCDIRSSITSFTIGNEVEHIPAYLCYEMSKLTEITIPNSVTSIGWGAFFGCSGLTEVTIPNSVTSIGWGAFSGCSGLTSVSIGNRVTSIGNGAFYDCSGLTSVIWNAKNCEDFGDYDETPFYDIRSNITSFTFGNEVEHIPASLCYDMSKLTEITIHNSVTSIGSYAFRNCSGLTSVIWNAKNCEDFGDYDETPFYKIRSNITSFTFGNEVEHIPAYLCYEMKNLKEVTIPNSVTSIGSYAFYVCSGLTKVNYLGTVDEWTEIDFDGWEAQPTWYAKDLYINNDLVTDVKLNSSDTISISFLNCKSIKSIEIGENVNFIEKDAFYGCEGLNKVNYLGTLDKWMNFNLTHYTPTYYAKDLYINDELVTHVAVNSIDSLKGYTFHNCLSVKSIEIGENVSDIDYDVFRGCTGINTIVYNANNASIDLPADVRKNITSIKFGNNVQQIPPLYNMTQIKEVDIPKGVTNIETYFFNGCTNLSHINIASDNPVYTSEDGVLFNKDKTILIRYPEGKKNSSYVIPNSVTQISDESFRNCTSLTSVSIPNSVITIGASAFANCNALTSVIVPSSVTSIHDGAFNSCTSLTSIDIPSGVTVLGERAFAWCNELMEINVSAQNENYTSKDGVLFDKKLTKLITYPAGKKDTSYTIPNSVLSIENYAFGNSKNLSSVNFSFNITSIQHSAFSGCSGLISIDIPESVTTIGSYAFSRCSGLTSVKIPVNLKSIGDYAFQDCNNITSVIWNAKDCKFNRINGYGYDYPSPFSASKESITSFTFGDKVENIPSYLCYGITGLNDISIPKSVNSIGGYAFYGTGFYNTDSNWDNGVLYIDNCLIKGKNVTGEIKIKEETRVIADNAFDNNNKITSIYIPTTVSQIGAYAFEDCYKLKEVYNASYLEIEKGSSNHGYVAYYADIVRSEREGFVIEDQVIIDYVGDLMATNITIPEEVVSINNGIIDKFNNVDTIVWKAKNFISSNEFSLSPFYNKRENITSFTFGDKVETIPSSLCYGMTGLKEISIPNSVKEIGENAFAGCKNLKKVTAYPMSVPEVENEDVFANYNAYLYVPCDVHEDYDLDDVFGNFKYIKCIESEEVDAPEKVEIEVDEANNASVIWPSTDGANSYELVISKDGEVFCTLIFNANGQLASIDFGKRSASVGFQFTVTGLDGASKYKYKMTAIDKKGNEITSYKGVFATNGYEGSLEDDEEDEPTDVVETLADANITISDGLITCPDAEFTIYNTLGQDVTDLNGALTSGVYVVQVVDDFVKVMMK